MKKIIIWSVCTYLVLFLLACEAGGLYSGSSTVRVEIQPIFSSESPADNSRAVFALSSHTVTLSAETDEGDVTSQILSFDSSAKNYTGSLSVKTGSFCTFTVEAKDSSGTAYVRGSSQKDITEAAETITLMLAPVVSDTAPVENFPLFDVSFEAVKTGQVAIVTYKPDWASSLTYKASSINDVDFAVCDEAGNTLASGSSEWTMEPGSVVYILAAVTGENPALSVEGSISLVKFTINLDDPENPVVNEGLTISPLTVHDALSVSVSSKEPYDEYKWILKNKALTESASSTITIELSDYSDLLVMGTNVLTLAFRIGGRWYSAVIPFTIVE